MVYTQKVGSTLAVKQLKDKAIKRSPRTNYKVSMQRKDNNKRNLEDVENAETINISTHKAKLIMKKLNNNTGVRQHWRHWAALMHVIENRTS